MQKLVSCRAELKQIEVYEEMLEKYNSRKDEQLRKIEILKMEASKESIYKFWVYLGK